MLTILRQYLLITLIASTYALNDTNSTAPSLQPTINPTVFFTTIAPSTDPTTTLSPSTVPTSNPITITQPPSKSPSTEPTAEPTVETTIEPSMEPTLEPTMANTENEIIVNVEIVINLSSGNATEDEIRSIILNQIDLIADNLRIESFETTQTENGFIFTFDIIANNEQIAQNLVDTIESDSFSADLAFAIENNTNSEVSNIESKASIVGKDDDKDDDIWDIINDWIDFANYSLLQWIIFGAACLILCVCCLFLCRCCWLCRKKKTKTNKNGYQVGSAMFGGVRPSSMDADDAFQNDLKNAIEMNTRGKLLKGSGASLADVDVDDVAVAFDEDLDETKKKKTKKSESKKENKTKGGDDDDAKTKLLDTKKDKKEGTETYVTPGGPDDDDEDNPPPAPEPPKNVQVCV